MWGRTPRTSRRRRRNININALNPSLLSQGSALTATVANPFYNNGGAGVIGGKSVSQVQLLLPYPTFSTINLLFNDSSHARYDSLVARCRAHEHGVHDALHADLVAQP